MYETAFSSYCICSKGISVSGVGFSPDGSQCDGCVRKTSGKLFGSDGATSQWKHLKDQNLYLFQATVKKINKKKKNQLCKCLVNQLL